MCGLVGMVGTLGYKHKRAMAELLYLSALRGRDSTGLTTVDRRRRYITRKSTVQAAEFIDFPVVGSMMSNDDQVWIGHTRARTTGEVSKANAHPFEVLDDDGDAVLIGAHNGTLNNKYEIERNLDNKFDTDSEALFNLLVAAPNFKEAIGKLEGAWSLTFWDPTADKMNFIRNKERPLIYAYTKDRKALVWASEAWMILAACRRNDIELETNDKGLSCYSTLADHLYSLEIPQKAGVDLPDLVREEGYVGQVPRFRQGVYNHWWNDEADDGVSYSVNRTREEQEAAKKRAEKAEADFKEDEKKIVHIGMPAEHRRGFEGRPIPIKEFEKIKNDGCAWCGDEFENVWAFIEDKAMVCGRCLSDGHPKGDCLRQGKDADDPPFDLGPEPDVKDTLAACDRYCEHSDVSEEHKRLIEQSVKKAVG